MSLSSWTERMHIKCSKLKLPNVLRNLPRKNRMTAESLRQLSAVHFCCYFVFQGTFTPAEQNHLTPLGLLMHTQPLPRNKYMFRLSKNQRLSIPPAQTVIFYSNFLISQQGCKKIISDQQSICYIFCASKSVKERFSYHHLVCWPFVYRLTKW